MVQGAFGTGGFRRVATVVLIGDVALDEQVLVVAEIGNNHEGDLDLARELVREAAGAGVGGVKFQTFRPEHNVSPLDEKRFEQLSRFALTYGQFEELANLARSLGLLFLSTALDLESARFLGRIADAVKIASGDIAFVPLLRETAATGRPMVVSTGISDLDQIEAALAEIRGWRGDGSLNVVLLHCVSAYPAPDEEADLRAIPVLAGRFECPIGYSDHTLGPDAAVVAVALGARVIEKHFTLAGIESDFRDHELSATPHEMREVVRRVARAETLLGKPEKRVAESASRIAEAIQRAIVAVADLPAGHVIERADLTWMRPAGGLPPGEEERLIGARLSRTVRAGEQLRVEDVSR